MAQIWKNRARRPAATGSLGFGYYPHGISPDLLNIPCLLFSVNDHRLVAPTSQFVEWFGLLKKTDADLAALILRQLQEA